jgi:DNA modification methylase
MDMFLGGFTTARVALELGREPLGFEINKKSFNHFYPRFHLKR